MADRLTLNIGTVITLQNIKHLIVGLEEQRIPRNMRAKLSSDCCQK
jgi:hypothetical protein